MRNAWIVGAGAALLLTAGFAAGRARRTTPAATTTAPAAPGEAPATSAAARSATPARAAATPASAVAHPLALVGDSAERAAPAPLLPSEPRPLRPGDVRDGIERAFYREPRDPQWSRSAERTAEARLRGTLPKGATLHAVECHASLCRIESTHDSLDEYQQFVERAFMKIETQVWNGASYSTPVEDGAAERGFPVAIVSYVAREGHALPQVE